MQNSSVLSEVLNGGCLNNVDDGYFQFVVSLLDETENNPALKRELEETLGMNDDFLPSHADFVVRERAFSWDLGFEEQLHEVRKRSNSIKLNFFDPSTTTDMRIIEPPYKKQNIRMDLRDTVATVQLESGSGATTVMPVFTPDCDSMSVKIGAYTREERQILIEKFRAKKKRRVWRKQIKYDCRKRLADTRPRVKGRFVSRKEKDGNSDGDSESMNNAEAEIEIGPYDDHLGCSP